MRPLCFLAFVGIVACDGGLDDGPVDFGDDYAVLQTPSVEGDRLQVRVQYAGGCAEHGFSARARASGEEAEVWAVHDANGDLCEALLSETLDLPLPPAAADAPRLRLRTPGGAVVDLR